MMKTLYEHLECRAEKHCAECVVNAAWRADVESFYGHRIVCPLGKVLAGETPEPTPRPPPPAPAIDPAIDPAEVERQGKLSWLEAAKRIAHGVSEVGKTLLNMGVAEPEIVADRKVICECCPYQLYQPCVFNTRHCCGALLNGASNNDNPGCGCVLENKWPRADAQCPKNLW